MKRWLIVLALVLAGCAESSDPTTLTPEPGGQDQETIETIYEVDYPLSDGRIVTCLVFGNGSRGGLDCDWDNWRYE